MIFTKSYKNKEIHYAEKIISTDGAYAPSVTKINYPSLSGLAANGQNNLQYAV